MKVYLSGPISNNPDATKLFEEAEQSVLVWADEVLNPMVLGEDEEWALVMREAITLMLESDAVYMLRGWGASRGAILERFLAQELDIPVFYQEKGKEQYETEGV
jgi:nucleoside 2-deoxyribosyltransferase